MSYAVVRRTFVLAAAASLGVLVGAAWAQDDDPTCKVQFFIVRDTNGKPVRDASVVLHPVNRSGKQARGGFELKTDNDGKTEFEGVPYGKMRIQVLAPGFQTYGDDYLIDKPNMDITVKLKRPVQQYSVYQDQNGTPKDPNAPPPKNDQQK
jgi:Carboxypeptidase regulatory-like domain